MNLQVAMRWRTEKEVVAGKGQFTCGERKCKETDNADGPLRKDSIPIKSNLMKIPTPFMQKFTQLVGLGRWTLATLRAV